MNIKLTYMEKTQVYLRKEELKAHESGPVGIWDGPPKRTSVEHDSVHDEP